MTEDYNCKVCGAEYEDEDELNVHKREDHSEFTEMYGKEVDGWGSPEETAKDIYDLGHPEEEKPAEEIEKQEDKPVQSHDDWLEDLQGLKNDYSYKNKGDEEDNQIYSDDEIEAHKKTGGTYPASWLEQANKMVPEDAEETGADEPLGKVQDLAESLERDWNRLKTEQRAGIFENLGISQGNSVTLANLSWNNLTGDLKKDASEAYAKEQQEPEPKEIECEICGDSHETDDHDEVKTTEAYTWAYDLEKIIVHQISKKKS